MGKPTHWRSFYLCLCAIVIAGAVMVLVLPRLAGLFLLGLYCIPTNSISKGKTNQNEFYSKPPGRKIRGE